MKVQDLLDPIQINNCQKKTIQLLTKLINQELNESEIILEIMNARISEKNKMLDIGYIAQTLNEIACDMGKQINLMIEHRHKAVKINNAISRYLSVKIKEKGPVENELIKISFENIEKLTIVDLKKEKKTIEEKASSKKPITKKRKK